MADHVKSRTRTIRLPHELWDYVEAEAEALDTSPNAVVHRRLLSSFTLHPQFRKPLEIDQKAEAVPA